MLHLYHHVSELIKLPIYDFARPPRPYTRLQSSLIDIQPLEFTITIKPFPTGKSLSPLESAIDHSVFLSRGFIDPIQDFNQVLLHVLIPLIHGLPIWGLLNSLSWSNLSLRERAFLYGKAQSIIVSSYQEVSYSRLFEYQWFVVNHLFIRLLSESDLRWMSVGIRKSILWILHVL